MIKHILIRYTQQASRHACMCILCQAQHAIAVDGLNSTRPNSSYSLITTVVHMVHAVIVRILDPLPMQALLEDCL